MTRDIMDWQRRFFAQPVVWFVMHGEDVGNMYESEEAAQIEVDWHRARNRHARVRIAKSHIHSLGLARERWTPLPTATPMITVNPLDDGVEDEGGRHKEDAP